MAIPIPRMLAADETTGTFTGKPTHDRYRSKAIYLSEHGVVFDDETDNTAAVEACVKAAQAQVAGTKTIVPIYGDTGMGAKAMRCDAIQDTTGVEFRDIYWKPPVDTGFTRHFGPATGQFDTSGKGQHRGGFRGCVIEGEKKLHPQTLPPVPPAPTVASSGTGTLTAGNTYGYRIAYRSPLGTTMPSPFKTASGATSLKVSWTNPSGLPSGTQVVIYGRVDGPWGNQVELAVVPATDLSWTDTGASTGVGPAWQWVDTFAPSFLVNGALTKLIDTIVFDMPGSYATVWAGSNVVNADGQLERWPSPMESVLERVWVMTCSGGAYHNGPHDSVVSTCFFVGNGDTVRNNMTASGPGPIRWTNVHFYGDARYACYNLSPGEFVNCQFEGGMVGQLMWGCAENNLVGGDIFHARWADGDPYRATVRGLVMGDALYNIASGEMASFGTKFRQFDSTTGPAIDLSGASNVPIIIEGTLDQSNGVIVKKASGTQPHYVRLTNKATGKIHVYDGGAAVVAI